MGDINNVYKKPEKFYDAETYNIIGAAMSVHRELGPGFLEVVYGDALAVELSSRGIPFEREKEINIYYKDSVLGHKYYADFVCYGHIIVELKAVERLLPIHEAQLLHYLKATRHDTGLLINFKELRLNYKQFVN